LQALSAARDAAYTTQSAAGSVLHRRRIVGDVASSTDRPPIPPTLLLAYPTGGHLGDRSPTAWFEDTADALAFVAKAVGIQVPLTKP